MQIAKPLRSKALVGFGGILFLLVFAVIVFLFAGAGSTHETTIVQVSSGVKALVTGSQDAAVEVDSASGFGMGVPPASQGADNASNRLSTLQCPVRLPADCDEVSFVSGTHTEQWRTSSNQPCRDFAYELLLGLQKDGFELVKADFLDLAGEAWGCTVNSAEGDVYVVSLIPARLGAAQGENNPLMITVVSINRLSPESQSWLEEDDMQAKGENR